MQNSNLTPNPSDDIGLVERGLKQLKGKGKGKGKGIKAIASNNKYKFNIIIIFVSYELYARSFTIRVELKLTFSVTMYLWTIERAD